MSDKKDLEAKYHNGTLNKVETEQFFSGMTQQDMQDLQDEVWNALRGKSYQSRKDAEAAEDRILMKWLMTRK